MTFAADNVTKSATRYETLHTRNIKLGIFVALEPAALICNGILVYYLIADRVLRKILYNHAILLLLIVTLLTNLIELPRIMDYLRVGLVLPQTYLNCSFWQWCDYLFYGATNVLLLWISIQRYFFIFYSHLYNTGRRRLLFHYLPSVFIVIYLIAFYTAAIFIYQCEEHFDFSQPLCGIPCYTNYTNISFYDLIAHSFIPLFVGIFLDVNLIIRVIYRRQIRVQQQGAQWRRYRKMILQLVLIFSVYSLFQAPYFLTIFLQLFIKLPDAIAYIQIVCFYYFFWFLTQLLPIVCFGCMPEVTHKFKNSLMQHLSLSFVFKLEL